MSTAPQLPLPDETDISRGIDAAAAADRTGQKLFDTMVASQSGAIVAIEVFETPRGPVLHIQASGNGRRMQPIVLDRYQIRATLDALQGAAESVQRAVALG